jgi:hypothetical protein
VPRLGLAIGLGLAVALGGLAVALSLKAPRLSGTNSQVDLSLVALGVPAGAHRCQYGETVRAGTGELRMFVGTYGRRAGPLEVTVGRPGRPGVAPRVVARASIPFGVRTGSVQTSLRPGIERDLREASLCVVNEGRGTVTFAGNKSPFSPGANPDRRRLDDEVRVDYLFGRERSWWSMAGHIDDRFGLAKTSFFGSWTLWAAFALLAVMWAGTVALLWRGGRAR